MTEKKSEDKVNKHALRNFSTLILLVISKCKDLTKIININTPHSARKQVSRDLQVRRVSINDQTSKTKVVQTLRESYGRSQSPTEHSWHPSIVSGQTQ